LLSSVLARSEQPIAGWALVSSVIVRCLRTLPLVCALLVPVVPLVDALAQEPEAAQPDPAAAKAREEFREGLALMAAEDYAGALAKFKAVAEYKQTAQVVFNIAECEERLGMLVRALGNYRLALGKAQDGSAPQIAELAPKRLTAIEPRIGKLSVRRIEPVSNPDARIELDGVEVATTQGDKALSVDPGERVLRVIVGERVEHTERITVAEGETKSIALAIPAPLVGDSSAPGSDTSGPSVPGIALLVGGGVSLALGAVFIGLRQSAIAELDELCGGDDSCPPSAEPTADRGRTFTGLAQVAIPVGVVAAVVGVVLLATGGGDDDPSTEVASSSTPSLRFAAPGADGPGASFSWSF
jgi:tetratricopeptide (TPR) repeat protein